MIDKIEWRPPSAEECKGLSCLVDYLMMSPGMLKLWCDFPGGIMGTISSAEQISMFKMCNPVLSSDLKVLVPLLQKVSGQKGVYEKNEGDKLTFQFEGVFRGIPFTLYDYKGDESIHVGGPMSVKTNSSWLTALKMEIVRELKLVS